MTEVNRDDGWRLNETLWTHMAPLLPPPKAHPLGGHRPRVSNPTAMDAILLVLRTGCNGMPWTRRGFVRVQRPTDASGSGSMLHFAFGIII